MFIFNIKLKISFSQSQGVQKPAAFNMLSQAWLLISCQLHLKNETKVLPYMSCIAKIFVGG